MFHNNEKISPHQALMMIIAGGIGTIYNVIATSGTIVAKRDAWLTIPLAYSISTIIGIFTVKLGGLFPDKTIIQYLPIIFGKFLGKLIGLIYISILFFTTGVVIRVNLETFYLVMPLTPKIAISIFLAILIVYVSICGFEVFARVLEFFMPIVIFMIVTIILLNIPNDNLGNLKPVLEEGIFPLVKSIPTQAAFGFETSFFMAVWFPCLNNKNEGIKILCLGMCICTIVLTLLTVSIISFFGSDLAIIYNFNFFEMSRYIIVGKFLTGFDALCIILWLVTAFIQVEVFFYPTVIGTAQLINLKNHKVLIFPVIIITMVLAYMPQNVIEVHNYDFYKNVYGLFPLGLTIPIIYFIAVLRSFHQSKF